MLPYRIMALLVDFGCKMVGDLVAHTFDPIFYALGMRTPLSIEASSSGGNEDVHPLHLL